VSNLILSLSLSAYILVALYSMIFSQRRLSRPGVSNSVRKLFWKKHSIYVVVFIIIWTVQLTACYFHLFDPKMINVDSKDTED